MNWTYKCNVVKRNSTEKVDRETTFHVFRCNYFTISYLFSTIVIENGRPEHNENVKHKDHVHCLTSPIEYLVFHSESYTNRKHKHIVACSNHN